MHLPHFRYPKLIILLAILALSLLGWWAWLLPQPNHNTLATGAAGRIDFLDVPIVPPAELDFKTKAEIYKLRQEAVSQQPELVAGSYYPSDAVFGQVEDGRPWWGTQGMFFYGSGAQSITGPSEEARKILNPFLLVEMDVTVPSRWAYQDQFWVKERITPADLARPDFPLYCQPQSLRWFPRQKRAEVTYPLSLWLKEVQPWVKISLAGEPAAVLDLEANNARDWNLNYISLSFNESVNLEQPNTPTAPFEIPNFIHKGNSCGFPGGCNNTSPYSPGLSEIQVKGFPATLVIHFWRHKPASAGQTPDLVFVIRLE